MALSSCVWQFLLLAFLPTANALAASRPATKVQDPDEVRDNSSVLVGESRKISNSLAWSNTAMGVTVQRWWLWRSAAMEELWPDACFMSMTKGNSNPTHEQVKAIKKSQCHCGKHLIQKGEDFGQDNLINRTGWANLEVKSRTLSINNVLKYLLPVMGPNAQVVNLGAGFDGRMYALKVLENATLFEFDEGDTQELKRHMIHRCHLKAINGKKVHMLPLNLENKNVYSRLFDHPAFRASNPTVFLSEAVAQYVSEEGNKQALKQISEVALKNNQSRLIFMSWQGTFANNIQGDNVKFGIPLNNTGLTWFKNVGWVPDLPKEVAEVKNKYDAMKVPYNYFNVFKAVASK